MLMAKNRKLLIRLFVTLGMLSTVSCGGTSADTSGPAPPEPMAIDRWWETAIPDFSDNPDRPVISLIGSNAIVLNIGDAYQDEGATATDLQDGDLTLQISIDNPVDTSIAANYLVRYSVADSNQLSAIEVVRIVRVHDGSPRSITLRPVGTTASHLGFVEHLPDSYTDIPGQTFPLLIFNHGSGANASPWGESGFNPSETLSVVLQNSEIALIIARDNGIQTDPMIVLQPQMIDFDFDDPVERFNAFVDFAVSTYNVDPSRIYVSGWSAGASLSLAYALLHPDRVAAVVPIAAGLRVTDTSIFPDGFCDVENVPIWAFHGDQDSVTPVTISIDNHESIINNCLPPVTPRLTIYQGAAHFIHHATYNLAFMENGIVGVSGDPTYDLYDQSILDWLLSHSLENRNIVLPQ